MALKDSFITFEKRSVPVSPNYRILFKIALILLILYKNSRGRKSSILRLQFFIWALKSDENQLKFKILINQNGDTSNIWSLDPTVIRALNFAKAENLIEFENGGVILTNKGAEFINSIIKSESLTKENEFLSSIGLLVTEQLIKKLSKSWAK